MDKVEERIHCGACAKRCPYHLKPYEPFVESMAFYRKLYVEEKGENS